MFWKLTIAVFILMIVFTGTNFRLREGHSTDVDWFVLARLLIFSLGLILGILLFLGRRKTYSGVTKAVFLYVATAGLAVITSPARKLILGYWVLLAGAFVLIIGMILWKDNKSEELLLKIERIWFLVMSVIVWRDVIRSALMLQSIEGEDLVRLGYMVSTPALLGLFAVTVFWMSVVRNKVRSKIFNWANRLICLYAIYASRTRIVLMCFVITGFVQIFLSIKDKGKRVVVFIMSILIIVIMFITYDTKIEFMRDAGSWFNRGESEETIETLAGRVGIWESALKIVTKESSKLVFGFGYGATRFYLNWKEDSPKFFASHCHNAYIEHLFGMGLMGLTAFLILIIISIRWLTNYEGLKKIFGENTCRNAVSIIVIVLISCLTEITMGGKINPLGMLFIVYILFLDRASWNFGSRHLR